MKRIELPEQIRALVLQLKRLPGIGPRSAERIALWLIQAEDADPAALAAAVGQAHQNVSFCPVCGYFLAPDGCAVCSADQRDNTLICVVEQPTDVLPLERSGVYDGSYHVLGGRLSPLDGIGPDDLRIESLLQRVAETKPQEIILALSSDVEGEATASYLSEKLAVYQVRITRLAQGLPAGGGLDHVDSLTVSRAIEQRR